MWEQGAGGLERQVGGQGVTGGGTRGDRCGDGGQEVAGVGTRGLGDRWGDRGTRGDRWGTGGTGGDRGGTRGQGGQGDKG